MIVGENIRGNVVPVLIFYEKFKPVFTMKNQFVGNYFPYHKGRSSFSQRGKKQSIKLWDYPLSVDNENAVIVDSFWFFPQKIIFPFLQFMCSPLCLKILLHNWGYDNLSEKTLKKINYFFASQRLVSGLQKRAYKRKRGFKKYPLLRW